jgi:hypothetical protein
LITSLCMSERGQAVAQLVETLRYTFSQNWVPAMFPGGSRRPVRRADNLTTFMCRLSWNVGAPTFWNPQGLPRPLQGLRYLHNWTSGHSACSAVLQSPDIWVPVVAWRLTDRF